MVGKNPRECAGGAKENWVSEKNIFPITKCSKSIHSFIAFGVGVYCFVSSMRVNPTAFMANTQILKIATPAKNLISNTNNLIATNQKLYGS